MKKEKKCIKCDTELEGHACGDKIVYWCPKCGCNVAKL
jgi:formamidopyrimidine-DNA glycosylase